MAIVNVKVQFSLPTLDALVVAKWLMEDDWDFYMEMNGRSSEITVTAKSQRGCGNGEYELPTYIMREHLTTTATFKNEDEVDFNSHGDVDHYYSENYFDIDDLGCDTPLDDTQLIDVDPHKITVLYCTYQQDYSTFQVKYNRRRALVILKEVPLS